MECKPSNSFRLLADGNKFTLVNAEHKPATSNEAIRHTPKIVNNSNEPNRFTIQQSSFAVFDTFFDKFEHEISTMQLQQKQIDKVYLLCKELIENEHGLFNGDPSTNSAKNYIIKKLTEKQSKLRRRTVLKTDDQFVVPKEIPIGLKWRSKKEAGNDIVDHKLIQASFQYVSITDSLTALFKNSDFKKMYFQYNEREKHVCTDSIYRDFCCGSNSKKFEIFDCKNTIQIQLGIDDFEPCNALKSKAGKHKMCGIYFQIRNIPEFCRSKLSSIFLVALVKTEDVKKNQKLYDCVFKRIVDDLKFLETDGIQISSDINLKGALVNISCDNLGANSVFGFAESFSCHFYCRMCESSKKECKELVRENPNAIRGKRRYVTQLQKRENSPECELKLTKGVKNYCPFNELNYFHILDNFAIDIMHDMYEGVIPFFLKNFFSSLISNNILDFNEIQAKVRDFDYGILSKRYYPSNIKLKRNNLGQCAAQSYNLVIHIPFIFAEYMSEISGLWKAMTLLLQILQILHSVCIRDDDVDRLKSSIEQYLSFLIIEFEATLTPKHHNMTHYPTVIRRMGPLIHMWMMRMECKHKTFTDMVKRTNNYKNLPKTLALQHQEIVCLQKDVYAVDMNATHSKSSYNIPTTKNFADYKFCMPSLLDDGKLRGLKFVKYGSYEYRSGLMIMNNDKVFEIIHIFQYQNKYLMVCHPYFSLRFETCYNSLEIVKDCMFSNSCLLAIDDIKNKKTYEKIIKFGKMYIFADTLDVYNKF